MQVSKWGNSLAVRLPADLVDSLGLKEGDDIELLSLGKHQFGVERALTLDERFALFRQARGRLSETVEIDRDATHER